MTDTELLEVLEAAHKKCGLEFVVMRQSTTGRGWRVHSVTPDEAADWLYRGVSVARTVREAIEGYPHER